MEHEEHSDICYFNQIPKEVKQLILFQLNLNLPTVIKIQSTSKEWRDLVWTCLTDLDIRGEQYNATNLATIIPRLSFNVLRKVIAADIGSNLLWNYDITRICRSLEYLDLGSLASYLYDRTFGEQLKNLSEYSFNFGNNPVELSQYLDTKCRIKAKIIGQTASDNKETPICPKINFSLMEPGEWEQKDPIKFNKKFIRGGVVGDVFIVIGATDGTLVFLKLNAKTSTLTIHASNNIHKGCINEIWAEQSQHTYVASSDGIVTAWNHSPDGPVLVQTIQFPEEITFVCDSPSKHVVAASSNKIFIADIATGKVIKTEEFNETITGLFGNSLRVHFATTSRFYTNYDKDIKNGVYKRNDIFDAKPTPNFWITPDASFRCVVFPNEVQCIDASSATGVFKTYSNPNSATFDARPGLLKFNPVRYWFSASTGTNIVTYDLEHSTAAIISSVSPRISRSEIDTGNFPVCNSLWWSTKGDFLFGLYSNDTLCCWALPRITSAEAQQQPVVPAPPAE